jgi:hypothetical protein
MKRLAALATQLLVALVSGFLIAPDAWADSTAGTSLPADFPVILDTSIGTPLLGFGAGGHTARTPVIFVHGNNDTPYAHRA